MKRRTLLGLLAATGIGTLVNKVFANQPQEKKLFTYATKLEDGRWVELTADQGRYQFEDTDECIKIVKVSEGYYPFIKEFKQKI